MKKYIDCDGVILDTESYIIERKLLPENYYELPLKQQIKLRILLDWKKILMNARVINDAIDILRDMDPNTSAILTKTHSLDNEGLSKIKFFRECNIKQEIILVPFHAKKIEVVSAKDNILIDDSVRNLDEWESDQGIPLFFSEKGSDYDGWNKLNTKHKKIKSLKIIG